MAIKVGQILISLSAETASFESAMTRASQMSLKTSASITRSLTLIGTAAASMGAAVEGAFATMVVKSENLVFSYAKMASTAGLSIESFSKLAYVARMAGVPVEQIAILLTRVEKSSYAAASGNQKIADVYKQLGVATRDSNGHLRDSGEVFKDLSVALEGYSEKGKAAIEQLLMGRSGAQVNSMMHLMAESGTELGKAAAKLGVIFTPDQVKAATTLHNVITNLEQAGLGFAVRVSTAVVPALDKAAQKLLELASDGETLKKIESIASSIGASLVTLANAFAFCVEHATAVRRALELLVAVKVISILTPLESSALAAGTSFDMLGLAALKMVGKFSGLSIVVGLMKSVTAEALLQKFMFTGLWVEEGKAVAMTYALDTALAKLKAAMIANPFTIALAGIAVLTSALWGAKDAADKSGSGAKTWGDLWHGAVATFKSDMHDVMIILAALATKDFSHLGELDIISGKGTWGQGTEDAKKKRLAKESLDAKLRPTGYTPPDPNTYEGVHVDLKQKDFDIPGPKEDTAAEKIIKRLAEIKIKADEATAALAAVGKSPQQLRDAEIDAKSKTFNADNIKASPAQMEQARADFAREINNKAAAEYGNDLSKLNRDLARSTQEQVAMNAALHQGAEAMQAATIASKVDTFLSKRDPTWKTNIALQFEAIRLTEKYTLDANAATKTANTQAIDGLKIQKEAQERLNAAILQGVDATEAAELANIKARIEEEQRDNTDKANVAARVKYAQDEYMGNRTAGILNNANSYRPEFLLQQQREELKKVADAAGIVEGSLDWKMILAADKSYAEEFNATMDKATLATGTAMEGMQVYFRQMSRDIESGAQQMHEVLTNVFTSLNDSLAALMTGQKANFANFFKGLADQFAHIAISKAEMGIVQGIAGAGSGNTNAQGKSVAGWGEKLIGLGKDASPQHVVVDNMPKVAGIAGLPGTGSGMGSGVTKAASGGLLGWLNDSNFFSGLFGGKLFGSGSFFGGGKATGGAVEAGVTYNVGEMGQETFTPSTNGTITPHNKLNSGHIFNIDARGSNDPAQTVAIIHRYMQTAAPQIAAHTMNATREQARRRP